MKTKRTQPTWLHKAQGEETRSRILNAAREVFFELSYSQTPVETIISRAGVSRASFYRHFPGKLAAAMALFDLMRPTFDDIWRSIAQLEDYSPEAIGECIEQLIQIARSERALFSLIREVEAIERGFSESIYVHRVSNIRLLGERFAAFEMADDCNVLADPRTVQAYMLILQIDAIAYIATMPEPHIRLDVARDLISSAMSNFIATFECAAVS